MSVEKDLIDYWANSTAETIDIAAFNFAMAFAMDNATIEHPAVVDLRKINFKKLLGVDIFGKIYAWKYQEELPPIPKESE